VNVTPDPLLQENMVSSTEEKADQILSAIVRGGLPAGREEAVDHKGRSNAVMTGLFETATGVVA
jgi:hypothetical protein